MDASDKTQSKRSKKRTKQGVAAWMRWLHIYLSMLGLIALLFFSATGITVNHPDWFSGVEMTEDYQGKLPKDWLVPRISAKGQEEVSVLNQLAIVEYFRSQYGIRGAVSEFGGDEYQLMVGFSGPAYTAYASIEMNDGSYVLTETSLGLVAIMNDLHKGRDTGTAWSWVIDISATIMVIASLSGLYLLFGLRKRKRTGLIAGIAGGLVLLLIYLVLVP